MYSFQNYLTIALTPRSSWKSGNRGKFRLELAVKAHMVYTRAPTVSSGSHSWHQLHTAVDPGGDCGDPSGWMLAMPSRDVVEDVEQRRGAETWSRSSLSPSPSALRLKKKSSGLCWYNICFSLPYKCVSKDWWTVFITRCYARIWKFAAPKRSYLLLSFSMKYFKHPEFCLKRQQLKLVFGF